MIGMVLGLILIGGAISIFLASKRSYTEVEKISALSENAQFAQRLLSNALMHAGFFGEVQSNRISLAANLPSVASGSNCSGNAAAYDLDNYLFAAVADSSGNALGCITDAEPGSHVLVIKSVIPTPLTDGPRVNPDAVVDPDAEVDPKDGNGTIEALVATQTYVMTNDTVGIMFAGGSQPSIGTGGDVPGGVAWAYQYEVFYVRKRDNLPPALSRKTLTLVGGEMTLTTEDLVEGIEDMRLRFGLADLAAGEVDSYTALTGMAGNWGRVVSTEISVLVRSATEDPSYVNPKSYSMAGASITRADNYRRVLITTSMSLRNPKLLIRGNAA
jgi:type IV pilus assembly protein PilW